MKEHRLKINAETQNNKHLIQILLQQICNHILDEKHTNGVRCFGWKGICFHSKSKLSLYTQCFLIHLNEQKQTLFIYLTSYFVFSAPYSCVHFKHITLYIWQYKRFCLKSFLNYDQRIFKCLILFLRTSQFKK
jgi:hypothetical protein